MLLLPDSSFYKPPVCIHRRNKWFLSSIHCVITSYSIHYTKLYDIPCEAHEKYLGIVLNETQRLTKLTNNLLSLNSLNSNGMFLEKNDFDINQVIKNTAASFEGTCIRKMIAIELILTGEVMFVNADITKIQQVLYNLLDNAIKFSHRDSVIKIETTEKHSKIFVSIKDSGIGIPKESLKMIWDRFYRNNFV